MSVRRSHAMPEITLRCPACKVLLKLKKLPVGKTAMPCPKCGTKVPLPREEDPEEEVPEVEVAEEEDQEVPAPRPHWRRAQQQAIIDAVTVMGRLMSIVWALCEIGFVPMRKQRAMARMRMPHLLLLRCCCLLRLRLLPLIR